MRLSDDMDAAEWQRMRNAQAAGGRSVGAPAAPARPEFDVDRGFLAGVEGSRSDMYVPTDKNRKVIGHSGPTIGIGVDLGSKDRAYLESLGISSKLVDQLNPYLGHKKEAALTYVKANPLSLKQTDLDALNAAVQDRELRKLVKRYNAASQVGPFGSLPRSTQSAIASLYFQYGTDAPEKATPNYWKQITTGDWEAAHRNLSAFGDAHQPRRGLEATKLREDIDAGRLPPAWRRR